MLKNRELVKKCLWTFMLISILILGQQMMLPSVDGKVAEQILNQGSFLQIFAATTGGRASLPSLFSIGLSPYMTAMIVWSAVQSLNIPYLESMSLKQSGVWQRILMMIFAGLQAWAMVNTLKSALIPFSINLNGSTINLAPWYTGLLLVAGSMFVAWMADVNGEKGIGSTVMLIIPGMIANLPQTLRNGWGGSIYQLTTTHLLIAAIITVCFTYIAVILYNAEFRIPIKRPMLESYYGDSYMPIKLLIAGAMPFMFSTMMFTLPQQIVRGTALAGTKRGAAILQWTSYQNWRGIILYAVVLMLLGYTFGYMNMLPAKTAKSLRNSGDYFVDVLPGEATEHFLSVHFWTICTMGNLILVVIGVTPLLLQSIFPGAANYSLFLGMIFIIVTIFDSIQQQFKALRDKYRYKIY